MCTVVFDIDIEDFDGINQQIWVHSWSTGIKGVLFNVMGVYLHNEYHQNVF